MITELDLQKAKGKSMAQHFKKEAAFHEKKAAHHEKCMKAHEGAADHHESMMSEETDHEKATGGNDHFKAHHKAKMNFHKTMSKHHETAHNLHKAHAEHHHAMAAAHSELSGEDTKNKPSADVKTKAAFAALEIEIEDTPDPVTKTTAVTDPPAVTTSAVTDSPVVTEKTAPVVTDPVTTKTGEILMSEATKVLASSEVQDDPNDVQKQIANSVQEALKNAIKENLASPEFRKNVQETVANVLLTELNKKTLAPTPVKVFAVPRTATQQETIATGKIPAITGVETVDPALAEMFSFNE
jgi:hypothetical protein